MAEGSQECIRFAVQYSSEMGQRGKQGTDGEAFILVTYRILPHSVVKSCGQEFTRRSFYPEYLQVYSHIAWLRVVGRILPENNCHPGYLQGSSHIVWLRVVGRNFKTESMKL